MTATKYLVYDLEDGEALMHIPVDKTDAIRLPELEAAITTIISMSHVNIHTEEILLACFNACKEFL